MTKKTTPPIFDTGWSTYLLPYIEETSSYSVYKFDKNFYDVENGPAVSTVVSVFLCPTAPHDVLKIPLRSGASGSSPLTGTDGALGDYFVNHLTSARFVATITDPGTGATSPFSEPVSPANGPAASASVEVALAPGQSDAAVVPGQSGVTAIALDLKASLGAALTGLDFESGGTGDEAAAIRRITVGVAEKGSLVIDSTRTPLAVRPGFARDDGKLQLLPFGAGGRQQVVTDPPFIAVVAKLVRGL